MALREHQHPLGTQVLLGDAPAKPGTFILLHAETMNSNMTAVQGDLHEGRKVFKISMIVAARKALQPLPGDQWGKEDIAVLLGAQEVPHQ